MNTLRIIKIMFKKKSFIQIQLDWDFQININQLDEVLVVLLPYHT